MAADWDDRDYMILWEAMLRGVYEVGHATIGRKVFVPVVFRHIEKKGYWGNKEALERYFHFRDDDDVYKSNVRTVTRRMIDEGYLEGVGESISITRKGINHITTRFGVQP